MAGCLFPSPREVNRLISSFEWSFDEKSGGFPSPREVNRFISLKSSKVEESDTNKFPSPLEVGRFISSNHYC